MAWTYDPAQLTIPLNHVRLLIGDTNPADQQMEDAEILGLIAISGSVQAAAVRAARALAARYARQADKWVGDLKILASQKHRAYLEVAKRLASSSAVFSVPSAGGVYQSEKDSLTDNSDVVPPSIVRGIHDFGDL